LNSELRLPQIKNEVQQATLKQLQSETNFRKQLQDNLEYKFSKIENQMQQDQLQLEQQADIFLFDVRKLTAISSLYMRLENACINDLGQMQTELLNEISTLFTHTRQLQRIDLGSILIFYNEACKNKEFTIDRKIVGAEKIVDSKKILIEKLKIFAAFLAGVSLAGSKDQQPSRSVVGKESRRQGTNQRNQ
jgi:hypothetical protein